MSETVFYEDGTVRITSARAILGNKTYVMANITSVSMGKTPVNKSLGVLLMIIGFGFAFLRVFSLIQVMGIATQLGISLFNFSDFVVLALGIGVGLVGLFLIRSQKPSYVVRIGSASGESDGLVSKSKDYIIQIVNAINDAIVKRG